MANFPPLKRHILYCVDQLIERHSVSGPFLDVGCGIGDVSLHLARKGWSGRAVDFSADAVKRAKVSLEAHPAVQVENGSLFDQTGMFNTVLAMDVVEHIEDDTGALAKIASLISTGGWLILSVPSNPREWRWDDDQFGHFRRYTIEELKEKLNAAGLSVLEIWDFTFPVFWWMRRAYTKIKSPSRIPDADKIKRTRESSGANPWEIPVLSNLLSRDNLFWRALSKWQFNKFRNNLDCGHEVIVLARKN